MSAFRRRCARPLRRALLVLALLAGCSRKAALPSAAESTPPPDLAGLRVAVFPVQPGGWVGGTAEVVPRALEGELVRALRELAPGVLWVMPADIERAVARNPSLDIRPRALSVGGFKRARLTQIGDRLYPELRAAAALVNARHALVPVGASFGTGADGAGKVELAAALIDTMGGSVLWFGVVSSPAASPADPGALSGAAEALALKFNR